MNEELLTEEEKSLLRTAFLGIPFAIIANANEMNQDDISEIDKWPDLVESIKAKLNL